MPEAVYKIVSQQQWRSWRRNRTFAGAPIDLQDGFVHLSAASQVEETAARHFAGRRDLMLVAVDADILRETLRYEPSRGGELFPHNYGALPIAAVLWATALPIGSDGRHVFPALRP